MNNKGWNEMCLSKIINSEKLKRYEELENSIHIVSGLTLEKIYGLLCEGYYFYKSDGISTSEQFNGKA